MKQVILALENIEKAAKSGDVAMLTKALESARLALSANKNETLTKLNEEVSIWQKKLSVIVKEPVGREGMARHAKHWIDELKKTEEL